MVVPCQSSGSTMPACGSYHASLWVIPWQHVIPCQPMGHTMPACRSYNASLWVILCQPVGHPMPACGSYYASLWVIPCQPVGYTVPACGLYHASLWVIPYQFVWLPCQSMVITLWVYKHAVPNFYHTKKLVTVMRLFFILILDGVNLVATITVPVCGQCQD